MTEAKKFEMKQKFETMDMMQTQNKSLNEANKIEFLKSLQAQDNTVFGIKSRDRHLDPSMNQIFTWGYEAPVKEDYTKNTASISNKIRKMGRANISECHDNYRVPESAEN
jgi:hypothetical protein